MYVRPQGERGIKIPENYSGHAFRDQNPYGDMPPPAHIPTSSGRERVVIPPQVTPKASPTFVTEADSSEEDRFTIDTEATPTRESENEGAHTSGEDKHSSIFSSLLPTATSQASHFPFGHGIGGEELLILAVMLLVFLSEESDQELLLLLGFLLFAG